MPGTILVSVLEFEGPQSSSSTPPKMSIKIAMGKKEYQTWGKEDFSFPLTTLRDNLMVKLHDAEGNVISHTGVETRLVVEKGLCDDKFPLEGGGYVRLKLQFVLSEEERHRIRIMRETALRKKHGDHPSGHLRSPESTATIGGTAESSLCLNHEVSDSRESLLRGEVETWQTALPSICDYVFGTKGRGEKFSSQKQKFPIDAVRIHQPPLSLGLDVHLTEVSHRGFVEKNPSDDIPLRAIASQEASSLSRRSEFMVAPKLDEDGTESSENQIPVGTTPSNVRKMISAFESGLAQTDLKQDMRPHLKSPPTIPQSTRIGPEAPLETLILDEVKTETIQPGRLKNPFLTGELEKSSTYRAFSEASTTAQDTRQLELNADAKNKGTADVKNKIIHNEVEIKIGKNPSKDLTRASTGKAATVSGRMLDEHIGRQQTGKVLSKKRHSGGKLSVKESGKGIYPEYSEEMDNEGASKDTLNTKENWKDKHYPSTCPGTWIFPVESKSLCMTTGSKSLTDKMVCCHAEGKINQGEKGSEPENVEQRSVHGRVIKVNEGDKTNRKPRNSKLVSSVDVEPSRGPIGQVMRVAIMIGFATLVIFTRQRKNS